MNWSTVTVEQDAQWNDADAHPKEKDNGPSEGTAETEVATISINDPKSSYAHARRLTVSERPEGGEVHGINHHPGRPDHQRDIERRSDQRPHLGREGADEKDQPIEEERAEPCIERGGRRESHCAGHRPII